MENKIPLVLASDENYAPFLCTTMYSILENTTSFIEFHILNNGISDNSMDLIRSTMSKFTNYNITYHDMLKFELGRFKSNFHLTPTTYSKLFIPSVLPDEKRVLYIDVDAIVTGDIKELYDEDMQGYPLAAALHVDNSAGEFIKEKVYPEMKNTANYFNAGVMLIDVQQFIQNNYTDLMLETCMKYNEKLQFAEQDVLNIVFEDNFKILDNKYNFLMNDYKKYKLIYGEKATLELIGKTKIFHYAGQGCKPWQTYTTAMSDIFWQVASKTLFKQKIEQIYIKSLQNLGLEPHKKLSIITICYNDPNLEKTCESIVNQTWQDFEWIVIDGGSNDETQKIWDKYKYRIDKFVSEPDSGIYNAYNKGIRLATGDYIILMNSGDDFYSECTLEQVYPMLNGKYEFLYGLTNLCWNDKNREMVLSHTQNLKKSWFIKRNINTQSVFVRKDLYDKYGVFDEKFKISGDKDKWLTFMQGGVQFKYVPVIIANYDMTGLSSVDETRPIVQSEDRYLLEKYYTKEEIDKENRVHYLRVVKRDKYSFWENIFSVKYSVDGIHKVITISGIHIKIKRNKGK